MNYLLLKEVTIILKKKQISIIVISDFRRIKMLKNASFHKRDILSKIRTISELLEPIKLGKMTNQIRNFS